ncbi:hypothetical protein HN709_00850 [Candidatus Peregrinibacteria bacterium]|jgi:hypothetical protein|nr:hypothetical protein [Candidatus Peregrinibacteria bacterium]
MVREVIDTDESVEAFKALSPEVKAAVEDPVSRAVILAEITRLNGQKVETQRSLQREIQFSTWINDLALFVPEEQMPAVGRHFPPNSVNQNLESVALTVGGEDIGFVKGFEHGGNMTRLEFLFSLITLLEERGVVVGAPRAELTAASNPGIDVTIDEEAALLMASQGVTFERNRIICTAPGGSTHVLTLFDDVEFEIDEADPSAVNVLCLQFGFPIVAHQIKDGLMLEERER